MASYTMPLRVIIEQVSQLEPNLSTRDKIEKGRKKLFDFDYPIFDENYRKVFETHFIRNFYTREIGFETESLFKFQLETWLLINMPYFNKMFQSELIEFDPLKNVDVTRDYNRKKDRNQNDVRDATQNVVNDGKSNTKEDQTHKQNTSSKRDSDTNRDTTGSTTEDNFSRQLESDTPDKRLAITTNDGQGVIEYASQIEENNENNKTKRTENQTGSEHHTSTGEMTGEDHATGETTVHNTSDAVQKDTLDSEINDIEDYIAHEVGKIGTETYQEMIEKYRDILLRIERDIFKEMNELFMLVY